MKSSQSLLNGNDYGEYDDYQLSNFLFCLPKIITKIRESPTECLFLCQFTFDESAETRYHCHGPPYIITLGAHA